jgi:hypothetical protein
VVGVAVVKPVFFTGDFAKLEWPLTTETLDLRLLCLDRSSEMGNEELAVGKDDLVNLWRLVEGNDGGPAWIKMMEKALPNMTYQAWRRDPPVNDTSQ